MAVAFATGAGRSFAYVYNVYCKDAGQARSRLLIMKHTILFAIFGAGIFRQYGMVFR